MAKLFTLKYISNNPIVLALHSLVTNTSFYFPDEQSWPSTCVGGSSGSMASSGCDSSSSSWFWLPVTSSIVTLLSLALLAISPASGPPSSPSEAEHTMSGQSTHHDDGHESFIQLCCDSQTIARLWFRIWMPYMTRYHVILCEETQTLDDLNQEFCDISIWINSNSMYM